MKYIAIALALLLIIAAGCVWNATALCRELAAMDVVTQEALDAAEAGAYGQAEARLRALRERWRAQELWLAAVIPHRSLEGVSLGIETALGLAQSGSEELISQVRFVSRSLRLLMDAEALSLGNVL